MLSGSENVKIVLRFLQEFFLEYEHVSKQNCLFQGVLSCRFESRIVISFLGR